MRGVQNLQLTDIPAVQPVRTIRAPPSMAKSRRPTKQRSLHQRAFPRCAQCDVEPEAYAGIKDNGLMMHTGQKDVGQPIIQESA